MLYYEIKGRSHICLLFHGFSVLLFLELLQFASLAKFFSKHVQETCLGHIQFPCFVLQAKLKTLEVHDISPR